MIKLCRIKSGISIEFQSSLSIRRLVEHPNIVGRIEAKVYESREKLGSYNISVIRGWME